MTTLARCIAVTVPSGLLYLVRDEEGNYQPAGEKDELTMARTTCYKVNLMRAKRAANGDWIAFFGISEFVGEYQVFTQYGDNFPQ